MTNFISNLYYRCRHGIKIYRNVLKEEERLNLLRYSKKYLKVVSESHPGLQTYADLHLKIDYDNYLTLNKLVKKMKIKVTDIVLCWLNYGDSGVGHIFWHTHPYKQTSIYYIENPEGLGTLFRHKGKEFRIDVPTNSLMIIPGKIEHTAPYEILTKPRYSFVIDNN